MSANETVHVSTTGGQKAGNDERYDLIPAEPLRRLAIHAGTVTFGPRTGSYHRMLHHAWAFWAGEETDQLTDWDHLTAAAWEAFCLVQPDWRPPGWVLEDRRPGRERYDRIPTDALRQLAKHFGVGAKKYDDDNWRRGYDWRLTFAAANRHAEQWRAGETHDPETGSHHLIAFAWHMLVLDEFTRIHPEFDTRTSTQIRQWLAAENAHNEANSALLAPFTKFGLTPESHARLSYQEAADVMAAGGPAPTLEQWEACTRDVRQAFGAPREPRVVDTLGETERDAQWTSRLGRYRWNAELIRWERIPECTPSLGWIPTICDHSTHGPYTEVLAPRITDQLAAVHNDTDWQDPDGVRWGWRDHPHGGGWVTINANGHPTAGWRLRHTSPSTAYGPYTEIL